MHAGETTLFGFSEGFDVKTVKVDAGAKLTAETQGGKTTLRVQTDHQQPWPGIELPCPRGHWDLSSFAWVEVDVRNPLDKEVRVEVRVDNPGADGTAHCVGEGMTLAGGAGGVLRVDLRRAKPDWIRVELFGMRGYPWGMPLPWGKATDHTIDPANVTNLVLFVPRPTADHAFEVQAVRAGGDYTAPTELLKDPDKFFPFIDEFGQYIHRDWPGKVHSVADLAAARLNEANDLADHPAPPSWDAYGGWKDGPALEATGFFHVAKHQGKWWLVDPEGRLFFSQGIDCVRPRDGATPIDERSRWFQDLPPKDSPFKGCYSKADSVVHGYYQGKQPACFDFATANLMRKYGDPWQAAFADLAHRRLRSWGINTIANWSEPNLCLQHRTPYTASIWYQAKLLPGSSGYWRKFFDVFDPGFAVEVRKAMAAQKDTTANDPWCIGYFADNEESWGEDGLSLALAALSSPADQPAKKVFLADLRGKYGPIDELNAAWATSYESWEALAKSTSPPEPAKARDDLAAFYTKSAETYFRTLRDAVKEVAPNHLYLGCRFAECNGAAAAAAAKFCDVVSFNVYRTSPSSAALPIEADVPILIGEFHFGALDRGLFHTGLVPVASQAQRASTYRAYVNDALADERIVGCHWFQYADEPTTGRYYDEENYQIGFVDVADSPYPEIVAAARTLGLSMYARRAAATRKVLP